MNIIDPQTNDIYIKGQLLGVGAYSKVFLATKQSSGVIFAVKIIDTSKPHFDSKHIQNEINIHVLLKHPNVLNLDISFYDNPTNFCIITDYCINGDLSKFVINRKRLDYPEIRFVISQISAGLEYIHQSKIIHRDIKLANILLDSGMNLKIADFGLSIAYDDPDRTVLGTPNYIAPEIILHKYYGEKVDIWSFGVVIYCLYYGKVPFDYKNGRTQLFKNIINLQYFFDDDIDPNLKNLISNILIGPKRRLSLTQIMNHPFMAGPIEALQYK